MYICTMRLMRPREEHKFPYKDPETGEIKMYILREPFLREPWQFASLYALAFCMMAGSLYVMALHFFGDKGNVDAKSKNKIEQTISAKQP
jgi:hypothetical protein